MACCCPGLIGAWFVGKSVKHQLNNEFGNNMPRWTPSGTPATMKSTPRCAIPQSLDGLGWLLC